MDVVDAALKESNVIFDFMTDVNELQCNANDIIIFVNGGGSGFEDIHNYLAAKSPRLLLSVSAKCDDGISTSSSEEIGSVYIAPEQLECIREVFLGTCGILISSGSSISDVCQNFMDMLDEQDIKFENIFRDNDSNFKAQLSRCDFQLSSEDNLLTINNIT